MMVENEGGYVALILYLIIAKKSVLLTAFLSTYNFNQNLTFIFIIKVSFGESLYSRPSHSAIYIKSYLFSSNDDFFDCGISENQLIAFCNLRIRSYSR